MQDLIKQKLNELKANMPDNPEFAHWIYQSDIWNWIYTVMSIEGLRPRRPDVVRIANGDIATNLPLSYYTFASRVKEIMEDMQGFLSMGSRLESKMIYRWVAFLRGLPASEASTALARTNCNVIYEWDLIPPPEEEVVSELDSLVRTYRISLKMGEPLDAILAMFLGMCKLYPFGEESVSIALVVLMFNLMSAGYPLPELPVNDREFNAMMARYMANGDASEFKSMIERSIYNRIEYINNLAEMANSKQ